MNHINVGKYTLNTNLFIPSILIESVSFVNIEDVSQKSDLKNSLSFPSCKDAAAVNA